MQPNNFFARRYAIAIIILIALALLLRALILGEPFVRLHTAPDLTGQVALGYTTTSNQSLPIGGKDFTLQDVKYFDNNQWVVATIKPLTSRLPEGGLAVLGRRSGTYQVAIGPGTSFSSTSLQALPSDVVEYIRGTGAVYEPISQ